MAFVANGDEEEKQPNGVAPAGAGGVHLAPGSGVGSPSAPGSGAAPQKDAGGSFASLDKYVNANHGQAQPLADKVTSGINDQYNSLNQGNQSTLQGIGNAVTNAPGYTKSDPNTLSAEAANPVSFAGDPNNVKTFQGLLNNSYSGPVSAEGDAGYQAQQAKINGAISQGNAQTQSEAGRQQLVKNVTATPTQSVTALNSAILSKDPNALSQIQDAYKPFNNLVSGLSTGAADINKQIAQQQTDAAQSRKAAADAIQSQTNGLTTALQGQVNAGQQAENAYNKQVTDNSMAANGAQPIAQDIAEFAKTAGLSVPDILNQWLSANPVTYTATPSANTVATPDQVATAGALQSLAGQSFTNPITDPTQAGTFKVPNLAPVTAPDTSALELNALNEIVPQAFTAANNVANGGRGWFDTPVGNMTLEQQKSALMNMEMRPSAPSVATQYENLLAQLAGLSNGVVTQTPASSGGTQYYRFSEGGVVPFKKLVGELGAK